MSPARLFIAFLALVLLFLAAVSVFAETLAWDPVTTYADGTPLDPAESITYRVYKSDTPTGAKTMLDTVSATQFALNTADRGKWLHVSAVGLGGEGPAARIRWLSPSVPGNVRLIPDAGFQSIMNLPLFDDEPPRAQ